MTCEGSTVIVTQRGYQLDVAVVLPADLNNSDVRGLLGNNNGFDGDDLISRSGQTVSPNATEETIYFNFGETCEFRLSHEYHIRLSISEQYVGRLA